MAKSKAVEKSTQFNTKKRAMIEALEKSLGIVTTACKNVGIERTTHYLWMREDVDYKKAVEDIDNVSLDFAESKLLEKIRGVQMGKINSEGDVTIYDQPPSDTAIIFYLKTKGKKRGYIEKQEHDVKVTDSVIKIKLPDIDSLC